MSDLALIRQLEDLLGQPLEEIPEARFERHNQAMATRDWDSPDLIKQGSHSITSDGAVSGLFLRPVTSDVLADFPFWQFSQIRHLLLFSQIRHLLLSQVNLPSFSFLAELKGLTSLDLRFSKISKISFLAELKGLTSLYLSNNQISNISFLAELKGLTSLYLSH
ncbi:MAG: Leucinerich repeat, partial [Cyanobacteriota bacterium]